MRFMYRSFLFQLECISITEQLINIPIVILLRASVSEIIFFEGRTQFINLLCLVHILFENDNRENKRTKCIMNVV